MVEDKGNKKDKKINKMKPIFPSNVFYVNFLVHLYCCTDCDHGAELAFAHV